MLWAVSKIELYSIPGEYTTANLHSMKFKKWHSCYSRVYFPFDMYNFYIFKNYVSSSLQIFTSLHKYFPLEYTLWWDMLL